MSAVLINGGATRHGSAVAGLGDAAGATIVMGLFLSQIRNGRDRKKAPPATPTSSARPRSTVVLPFEEQRLLQARAGDGGRTPTILPAMNGP